MLRLRGPAELQLLRVDDLVCLQDLAHQITNSLAIELPHVMVALRVYTLKVLGLIPELLDLRSRMYSSVSSWFSAL